MSILDIHECLAFVRSTGKRKGIEVELTDHHDDAIRVDAKAHPPRIWTVFGALLAALVLAVVFQVAAVAAMVGIEFARGTPVADLQQVLQTKLTDPLTFILIAGLGQLGFAFAGFVAAWKSPEPFRKRVAWFKPNASPRIYPVSMIGSILPLAIGLYGAIKLDEVLPADDSLVKLFEAINVPEAVFFVLFIGVVPAFVEEVLFRGYMQQRFLRRWRPATAITVTAILFSLVHVTPHGIIAVVPIGFWLGYIAWKSGSILPGILCHFFVNAGLNTWRMVNKFVELSDVTKYSIVGIAVLAGTISFLVCFMPAFWQAREDSASPRDS